MEQEELLNQIAELEREIAILPEGSITKKRINGKEYYYHRITQNGKRSEKYIRFEEIPELSNAAFWQNCNLPLQLRYFVQQLILSHKQYLLLIIIPIIPSIHSFIKGIIGIALHKYYS